jgi:ATP/maltotriose-dependent transcriptional regulator MalT
MQRLEMLFDSEPTEAHQLWLPQRYQLVLRPRPQLVVVREIPSRQRQQHRVSRSMRQAPPFAYRARLHPQDLCLTDFQLVPLAFAQATPATSLAPAQPARVLSPRLPEPLSSREHELLQALAQGDTNRELAARFHISVGTVRWHLTNIYGKLGVRRRTQALARAQALGLLSTEKASAQP